MINRLSLVVVPITLAFALLVVRTSQAGRPQPLDACGQTLEGRYFLAGDLDCAGIPGHGVYFISRSASLELRGFTLSNASIYGVQCQRNCKIIGPGTISGSAGHGVRVGGRARVFDTTITNNGAAGVRAANNAGRSHATLVGSHVEGNDTGVYGDRRVKLIDSTVTSNTARGVVVDCVHGKSTVKNSIVTNNGANFDCE